MHAIIVENHVPRWVACPKQIIFVRGRPIASRFLNSPGRMGHKTICRCDRVVLTRSAGAGSSPGARRPGPSAAASREKSVSRGLCRKGGRAGPPSARAVISRYCGDLGRGLYRRFDLRHRCLRADLELECSSALYWLTRPKLKTVLETFEGKYVHCLHAYY